MHPLLLQVAPPPHVTTALPAGSLEPASVLSLEALVGSFGISAGAIVVCVLVSQYIKLLLPRRVNLRVYKLRARALAPVLVSFAQAVLLANSGGPPPPMVSETAAKWVWVGTYWLSIWSLSVFFYWKFEDKLKKLIPAGFRVNDTDSGEVPTIADTLPPEVASVASDPVAERATGWLATGDDLGDERGE